MIDLHAPIPKDVTCRDLFRQTGGEYRLNYDFFCQNSIGMYRMAPNDIGHEIFKMCSAIYDVFEIDYFPYYSRLRYHEYGDFYSGIKEWFYDTNGVRTASLWGACEDFRLEDLYRIIVDSLKFFELPEYDHIPRSEFEEVCPVAGELGHEVETLQEKCKESERRERQERREDAYFNFEGYSEKDFQAVLLRLLSGGTEQITVDEALEQARRTPPGTYIVFLNQAGKITHIGMTENLLSYIYSNSKKYHSDTISYHCVDRHDAADLVIALRLKFDVAVSKIRPDKRNRKYTSVGLSVRAYRGRYQISKRKLMAIIEKNHIPLVDITDGWVLVDKIDLWRAISPFL